MKRCIACGMPMNEVGEFACGDIGKDYCVYCARPDGSMKSFEEKREDMIAFTVRTQGFDQTAAAEYVAAAMKKLPAWQDHFA